MALWLAPAFHHSQVELSNLSVCFAVELSLLRLFHTCWSTYSIPLQRQCWLETFHIPATEGKHHVIHTEVDASSSAPMYNKCHLKCMAFNSNTTFSILLQCLGIIRYRCIERGMALDRRDCCCAGCQGG